MTLKVHPLVGDLGMTIEDGQKVFEAIHAEISAGQPVELDFAGVKVFATPFFNASVGQLLKDVEAARLQVLLKCSNLTAVGESVMKRVIKNSEEYYRNPAARRALDSILSERPEK